ncbi:hypothetical protein ABIE52_000562 [Rhodococcus sp. OAS809]
MGHGDDIRRQANPQQLGRPKGPNRWIALVVLILAHPMNILDFTNMKIALPSAQYYLGFFSDARQWVVIGYVRVR